MSQLLRPATAAPVTPRSPGGAIVRATSPGQIVQSAPGAMTPWIQRIRTGLVGGSRLLAGAGLAPAAGLGIGLGLGGAILGSSGRPGTARMSLLGGDAVPPTPARRPYYGPAFGGQADVTRPSGGGNAGRSVAPAPAPSAPPPAPGAGTTAITGNFSGGSRAANALQNAAAGIRANGLGVAAPAWSWDDNPAMRDAAMTAGRAAAAARGDTIGDNGMISQRGGGYLSRDQLPAASNPANDAYWARADMNAWANANKALAAQQGWVEGRDYNAANTAGGQWQTPSNLQAEQAILQGQAAGIFDRPGVTANTPEAEEAILAAQSAGVLDRLPRLSATAGASPNASAFRAPVAPVAAALAPEVPSFEAARQESLREAHAIDPVAPAVAPPAQDPAARIAPGQMRSGPETEIDLAQALNSEHLQNIKLGVLRGDENLTAPPYFQGGGSDQQGSWPWGRR
jgi:hypothetical protein